MKISNYSLIIILAFFANFCLKAQTSIKDDVSNLKKGIYKNFDEFKYNTPSIKLDYEILVKNVKYGAIGNKKIITYYRLDVTKEQAKSIGTIYGFCDGKHVYINEYKVQLRPKTTFSQLDFVGEYCLYEGIGSTGMPTVNNGFGISNRIYKILNINNRKVSVLTKRVLKKIISDDPKLLAEFKKRRKKYKILKRYFLKYFERKKTTVKL
ncbi:hypothetical protein [Aquimarina aquimarini]|uniref:hypothetical protein n=1 Tax=Aquimarina aquimarini TaxID=1191734 RepID=UPI000D561D0A|nr:hypothetical protein [Aquimarina aquimarini]